MTVQFDQADGGTAAQIGQLEWPDSRPQGTAADDDHLALGHCRRQRIYLMRWPIQISSTCAISVHTSTALALVRRVQASKLRGA